MSAKEELTSFLTGLLVGGLVGTAFGVLVAPNDGRRNRSEMMHLFDLGRHKADELGSELDSSINELAQILRYRLNAAVDNLREVTGRLVRRFDEITNQGAGVLIEDEIL